MMEFLTGMLENSSFPILTAFILGLMTAISPCPLATNITAIGFISKDIVNQRKVFLNGLVYTLGRAISYTTIGLLSFFIGVKPSAKFRLGAEFNYMKNLENNKDLNELLKFRHGKMQSSIEDLASSLKGHLTTHHKFMLKTIKESIDDKEKIIAKLNEQIENQLKENELKLDAELLSSIPGVGKDGASYILAEIGNNMDQFPNEQHLSKWAGMSPGNNETAGKKKVAGLHMGTNI